MATVTELCPVYAPFFGALVGIRLSEVRLQPLTNIVDTRAAPLPSCSLVRRLLQFVLLSY